MKVGPAFALAALMVAALLQLSSQTELLRDNLDICRLLPDGTTLRKPGSCQEWITCKDHKTEVGGTCEGTTQYILSKGTCGTKLDSWDTYCKAPCTRLSKGYVATTRSCTEWYYCEKTSVKANGICPNKMYFDQKKQMCVYPEDMICQASYELCNVVGPGVIIQDETSCSRYLTCVKGVTNYNECPSTDYFDLEEGGCRKKSLVNCKVHPLPENVCGSTKLAYRDKFVSDGATCRGYYYCKDLGSGVPDTSPLWQQCDVRYFFDGERERCALRENFKCLEDRCDGRTSGREVAEVPGCHHYIECENGAETGVFECEDNKYFDVTTQTCVEEKRSYLACAE